MISASLPRLAPWWLLSVEDLRGSVIEKESEEKGAAAGAGRLAANPNFSSSTSTAL